MLFQRNDTVLFIGDSITDYNRARPVGEGLYNAWGTSYAAMASSLLCAMYPELHLRMINMGISGNQIRDLDKRWQTDVLDLKPDWVVVLIGINDVGVAKNTGKSLRAQEFASNYDTLIRRLLEASIPSVFLMSPFLFSRPQEYLNWLPELREAEHTIETLARQYQLPFLTLQDRMQEAEKYGTDALTPDGIHLTAFGHELLAKWWLEAFADFY